VISVKGEKRWYRDLPIVRPIEDIKTSLNGNRFGINVTGHVIFDAVTIPKNQRAILIYDRSKRTLIFQVILERITDHIDFELSHDGQMLAILIGNTLRLYKLPS
jgi:hypothetical protein